VKSHRENLFLMALSTDSSEMDYYRYISDFAVTL